MNPQADTRLLQEKISYLEQDNQDLLKQVRMLQDELEKYYNKLEKYKQFEANDCNQAKVSTSDDETMNLFVKTSVQIISDLKSIKL